MKFLNIDFQRVGWLLRQIVSENWKTQVRYYLGLQIGFLITFLVFVYNAFHAIHNSYDYHNQDDVAHTLWGMSDSMSVIGTMALYAAFIFSASAVFSLKTERSKRIVQLMIPATTAEKVLSRFIYYNLGAIVLSFIALLITDATGCLIVEVLGFDYTWFIPKILANISHSLIFSQTYIDPSIHPLIGFWCLSIFPIFSIIVLWSFYLWGGAVFRKKSFIMTSLVCFIIFVVFITFGTIVVLKYTMDDPTRTERFRFVMNLLYSIYFLIACLWLVLNLYFAYRIRKRASLMPRHWYGQ